MFAMPLILVTNDDGYRSEGIRVLAAALTKIGDVTIVAPIDEASAIGHALTLKRPLRLEHMSTDVARSSNVGQGFSSANIEVYAVDGTPTDCVNIAITQVFKRLPDLIVSGINKGWNLGDDVTYSGTVAGALEGALLGVAGIAVSLAQTRGTYDFSYSAAAAATMAEQMLAKPLPLRTFLNINLPKGEPKGFRVTVQAKRNHITSVATRKAAHTSGSRKGRTSGSRTIAATTRRCAMVSCRSRRSIPISRRTIGLLSSKG
jgi:5'-nucleotidase